MSTSYENTVLLLAPADRSLDLTNALANTLSRTPDNFLLRATYGASGAGPITHKLGSGVFTDDELDGVRVTLSVGGTLYLLGCRARRLLNEASETVSGEPGKTSVTVYDVGDTLPAELDWTSARVTKAFFVAEQSLVSVQPAL